MSAVLIVTTTNDVLGYEIKHYVGVVRGLVVRAPTIGQSFIGGLNSIFGGNIEAYEDVCEAARQEAMNRMIAHAIEHGANAIIAMRYDTAEFASGVTEVLCYGTAVKIEPVPAPPVA